ncbi:hypothetical protein pb186bvf_012713 [Paramecium bursaria]
MLTIPLNDQIQCKQYHRINKSFQNSLSLTIFACFQNIFILLSGILTQSWFIILWKNNFINRITSNFNINTKNFCERYFCHTLLITGDVEVCQSKLIYITLDFICQDKIQNNYKLNKLMIRVFNLKFSEGYWVLVQAFLMALMVDIRIRHFQKQ